MKSRTERMRNWITQHKKRLLLGVPLGFIGLIIIGQFLYPTDRLLPGQHVDGVELGGWTKQDAQDRLDVMYRKATLELYFGDVTRPQYNQRLSDIGVRVSNGHRIEEIKYAWYLRLLPSSVLWAHRVADTGEPVYTRDAKKLSTYMSNTLGDSCEVAPVNASAKVKGSSVVTVDAVNGGTCADADVKRTLETVEPSLDGGMSVRIKMKEVPAPLTAEDIKSTIATLNARLATPIKITYDAQTKQLDPAVVRGWLKFTSTDERLEVGYDEQDATKYLDENYGEAIARPAGVSKVTTHDFVEVSREEGSVGRALDPAKTLMSLSGYLAGRAEVVPLGELAVAPRVEYTRSYSNTDKGLSALMKNYAESHPGTYGVSLIELDGKRRRAAYEDTRKFTTASTYKLYVGYSALRRVESGEYKWSDQISDGRDLAKCFDDMIVKSDNACAEALVAKIGYRALTTDAQTIVSGATTFLDTESYKTTAGDLSTFMASLATGQMSLNNSSQARFIDALKRNRYRQGIPAGAGGVVADKVGFLDGLLHDAAIVYGANGTYALSIMSNKSSWENIAELTREIEALKSR